jgi:hypothetical protein
LTSTGSITSLRYHGFIPAAYVVRLFVLLSKGLESYEASKNEKEGKIEAKAKGGAWGAVLAQGFGGGAVSVLRLAGSPGGGAACEGHEGSREEQEQEEGEVEVEAEAEAKIDGAGEGEVGKGNGNGDEDVVMAEEEEDAGAADASASADGGSKIADTPAPKTAQSQSGNDGKERPVTAKEGARIICWEYPAPLL